MSFKKIIVLFLVVVMVCTVFGCSNQQEAAGNKDGDSNSKGSSENASEEEIRIGNYTYLTGNSAALGINIANATELAVEQINKEGGIKGRNVKLFTYDDAAQPETTVQVVTRLIDVDKVHAIIGSSSSPCVLAVAPMIEQNKIVTLSGGVSTGLTNGDYSYIFRSTSSSEYTNKTLVDTMADLDVTKLGVLCISSEYGKDGLAAVTELATAKNIDVIAEFYNPGDTDYSGQISKLLNDGASHIMLYGNTPEQAIGMKQLRRMGYDGYAFGTEGCSSPEIRRVAGEAANGLIFASTTIIPDTVEEALSDIEKQFLEAYVEKFGEMPMSDVAYRAYDGIILIFEAMRNAEDIDDTETIRDAFIKIKGFEGIAGEYDFTAATGDGLTASNMFIVENDKNIPLSEHLANK